MVDAVEIHADRLPLLAVPALLGGLALEGAWGGALLGFVETGALLWPVVSLARMNRGSP